MSRLFKNTLFAAAGLAMAALVMVGGRGALDGQAPYRIISPLGKLNIQGTPAALTITKGVGSQTNQTFINITTRDKSNGLVPAVPVTVWLSDDTGCAGITATTASGTADTIGTTGTNFGALTAKKVFLLQSSSTGSIQLGVLDSAKTHFVTCAHTTFSGTVIGPTLATGDYK